MNSYPGDVQPHSDPARGIKSQTPTSKCQATLQSPLRGRTWRNVAFGALTVAAGLLSGPAQTVPPAPPASGEVVELSPFTVNTSKDRGYASSNAMAGSRVAIPLSDLPSTVVVVNE